MQLIRVPNLFTVPGDILAGYFLAGTVSGRDPLRLAGTVLVSMLLYVTGLILNDIMDIRADRRLRPQRPLAAGDIAISHAAAAVAICAAAAILLAVLIGHTTLIISLILLGTIAAYDLLLKRMAVTGAAGMGLCRGLNILLGASLQGWPSVPGPWIGGLLVGCYIAGVTLIARNETSDRALNQWRWMPFWVLTAGLLFVAGSLLNADAVYLLLVLLIYATVLIVAFVIAWRLRRADVRATRIQHSVGILISMLIGIQITLVLIPRHATAPAAAALLVVCLGFNRVLGRRFQSS
jgi:4-hydroxybenzoate polyprenyltransferase